MLISMTGFGVGHYEDSSVVIDVELKSFNSRYFELNTRSFDLSGESEYNIRTFLKNKLKRGSVNLNVKIDSKDQLKLNKHKLESILKSYKEIEKDYKLDLNYSHLLKNNDMMSFRTLPKSLDNKVLKAVKIATKQVLDMREKEGKSIEKEFVKYITIAKKDLDRIDSIYQKLINKKINSKAKNESKIEELEKLDVTEEIDRTKSHFNQIMLSVKSKDLSGKKINFILQEINRESNTILSKFLDKKIAKHAISLKMQAEKLREQVSNIL
jgi:uncharacterized protein (TIGR00255 family)